jgi:hypothetical protein
VHELCVFWDFVVRDLVYAEMINVTCLDVSALLQDYQSHSLLAVLRIRDADHLDVVDTRHLPQILFDFLGVNILTSPNDHILDSTHNSQIAIVVHFACVASPHPAINNGLLGGLLIAPIAQHDGLALDHYLARMADLYCFSILINYLGF